MLCRKSERSKAARTGLPPVEPDPFQRRMIRAKSSDGKGPSHILSRGLDQGENHSAARGPAWSVCKQKVLPVDDKGLNAAFGPVAAQLQPASMGRFRVSSTHRPGFLQASAAVDLEKDLPRSTSITLLTFRFDASFTTISAIVVINAPSIQLSANIIFGPCLLSGWQGS